METAVVVISAALVLGAIWWGDWLCRAIDEYDDDIFHR